MPRLTLNGVIAIAVLVCVAGMVAMWISEDKSAERYRQRTLVSNQNMDADMGGIRGKFEGAFRGPSGLCKARGLFCLNTEDQFTSWYRLSMKRLDSLEVSIPYSESVGGRRVVKLRATLRNSGGSLDAAEPTIADAADRAMALLGVSSDLARRCKAQQGSATLSGNGFKLVCERRFWPAKYKGEVDMSTWSADIELP